MEISDIQLEGKFVVITFCNEENQDDIMTLKLHKDDAWTIHHFCQTKLSYAAQLKESNFALRKIR